MNRPPSEFSRISNEDLHAFVSTAAQSVGLPQEKAELLASLLAGNDLRGVFSHGTQQIATYARLMRDGKLNNKPEIDVVESSPCRLLVDGDGGVGYFPAHEGTARVIEKAKENGIAVMVTRNHGHFGAAGLYSRMTLEHDLVTFVTSGVQQELKPGDSIFSAGGGSPMSFSAPAGEEDSLVLDFGAMHDLYGGNPTATRSLDWHPAWCFAASVWGRSANPGVGCWRVCPLTRRHRGPSRVPIKGRWSSPFGSTCSSSRRRSSWRWMNTCGASAN